MTEYQSKRMLVTGGAGFIGSHFVRHMVNHYSSLEIINLDALTYAGSLQNIADIIDRKNHYFVQGNITDRALISELFSLHHIDTVIHFAAESHVDRSIIQPDQFIQTNIVGTFTLLEVAKDFWQKNFNLNPEKCRFHHISTDEVYGSLEKSEPPCEETSPYRPQSPYSASKASSDFLVRAYFNTYKLPYTLSNCSNNFGSYQHAEKFIPTIILSCLKHQSIPIYGDGSHIRDWLYVLDHCQAIDKIIHFGKIGHSYNIGGNKELSNLQLAQLICQKMDYLCPINRSYINLISFVKDRPGHDWRYALNSNKIKNEMGWQPNSDFDENLLDTIHWFLHNVGSSLNRLILTEKLNLYK
jgi:dTDP-glucose 4,6-dehydratase